MLSRIKTKYWMCAFATIVGFGLFSFGGQRVEQHCDQQPTVFPNTEEVLVPEQELKKFVQEIKESNDLGRNLMENPAGEIILLELDYQDNLSVRDFEIISSITTIEFLAFRGNILKKEYFSALADSKSLVSLNLSGSTLDEDATNELIKLDNVRTLNLQNTNIPQESIQLISKMTRLETLMIGGNQDVNYDIIANLCQESRKLRKLRIHGDNLDSNEIIALHRKYPDLYISWTDQEVGAGR